MPQLAEAWSQHRILTQEDQGSAGGLSSFQRPLSSLLHFVYQHPHTHICHSACSKFIQTVLLAMISVFQSMRLGSIGIITTYPSNGNINLTKDLKWPTDSLVKN